MNVDNFPMGFPNLFLRLTHGKLVGGKKLTRFWRPWNLWDKVKATGHSWPQLSISVLKEKESLALGEQEILEPQNKHESLERIIPFLAAPNHAQLVCDSYMASNWHAGRDL